MVSAHEAGWAREHRPAEHPGDGRPRPLRAADTTPERPWPVRHLSPKIADYIAKMPPVWVEGQVLNLKRWNTLLLPHAAGHRPRHVAVGHDAPRRPCGTLADKLADGAHVVVHARPQFHAKKGTLTFAADDVRLVGVGELLARIEHLKGMLAAEGLFEPSAQAPAAVPARGGRAWSCAQQGDAEHDVVSTRGPAGRPVEFEIREVDGAGRRAPCREVSARSPSSTPTRGSTSSSSRAAAARSRTCCRSATRRWSRVAAACRTPLVSAIGHETDTPLLDLVADYRASTPTDAAKRIVPDVAEERSRLDPGPAAGAGGADRVGCTREQAGLDQLPQPSGPRDPDDAGRPARAPSSRRCGESARRALHTALVHGARRGRRLAAQVRALSPAATLDRGYAVVQRPDGHVVRDPADVVAGDDLRVRVARGELTASVTSV